MLRKQMANLLHKFDEMFRISISNIQTNIANIRYGFNYGFELGKITFCHACTDGYMLKHKSYRFPFVDQKLTYNSSMFNIISHENYVQYLQRVLVFKCKLFPGLHGVVLVNSRKKTMLYTNSSMHIRVYIKRKKLQC